MMAKSYFICFGTFIQQHHWKEWNLLCLFLIWPKLFETVWPPPHVQHNWSVAHVRASRTPNRANFWQCRKKMSKLYCYWFVQWETILNLSNVGVPLIVLRNNWIVTHVTWAFSHYCFIHLHDWYIYNLQQYHWFFFI